MTIRMDSEYRTIHRDTRLIFGAEHERLGRAVTDSSADYARSLDAGPVCSAPRPPNSKRSSTSRCRSSGSSAEEILARFERDVLPHAMNIPSPRYYGLFNPTPLPDRRLGRRARLRPQPERRGLAQLAFGERRRGARAALAVRA